MYGEGRNATLFSIRFETASLRHVTICYFISLLSGKEFGQDLYVAIFRYQMQKRGVVALKAF